MLPLLLLACRGTEHVPVELEDGSALVAVVLDAEGAPSRAFRLDQPGGGKSTLELAEEESAVTFELERSAFVDALGSALDDATWQGLLPLLPDQDVAALGRCGRCQIPSDEAPQNVVPGDRCRAPGWLDPSLVISSDEDTSPAEEAQLAETARSQLELAWPGDCDCEPPPLVERMDAEVCPLGDPREMVAPTHLAITNDGTVFGLSPGFALRVSPAGEVEAAPILPAIRDIDEVVPMPDGGQLIVASRSVAFGDHTAMLRSLGPDLQERGIFGLPSQRTTRVIALGTDQVALLGRLARNPSFLTCQHAADATHLDLSCRDWLPEDSATCPLLHYTAFFEDLLDFGAEGQILVSTFGALARLVPGENRLACVHTQGRSGPSWTLSPEVTLSSPSLIAVRRLSQDRFIAIVSDNDSRSVFRDRWATVVGRLERSPGAAGFDRVRFELSYLSPDGETSGRRFLPLVEGPGAFAVSSGVLGTGALVIFDENGVFVGKEPALSSAGSQRTRYGEIQAPIEQVIASPDGAWVLALDTEQDLYRRSPQGELLRIAPRSARFDMPTGLVVELDDDHALALTPAGAFRVRPGSECGEDELEPVVLDAPLPPRLASVAQDPSGGARYLVLAEDSAVRLDLERGTVRQLDIPVPTSPWHIVRALGPESFVLADRAGVLFVLHPDDRLEPLSTDRDPALRGLYDVAVAGGVLWTAGPSHLGRYRFVEPSRLSGGTNLISSLDAESWRALESSRLDAPDVDALAPRCRDVVLLHTLESLEQLAGIEVSDIHRYWMLGSSASGYTLDSAPSFEIEGPAVARLHESTPELRWRGDRAFSISTAQVDSTVYTFGTSARALPFASLSSVAEAGGWLIAAGGRLQRLVSGAADETPVLHRRAVGRDRGFRLAKIRATARR